MQRDLELSWEDGKEKWVLGVAVPRDRDRRDRCQLCQSNSRAKSFLLHQGLGCSFVCKAGIPTWKCGKAPWVCAPGFLLCHPHHHLPTQWIFVILM